MLCLSSSELYILSLGAPDFIHPEMQKYIIALDGYYY